MVVMPSTKYIKSLCWSFSWSQEIPQMVKGFAKGRGWSPAPWHLTKDWGCRMPPYKCDMLEGWLCAGARRPQCLCWVFSVLLPWSKRAQDAAWWAQDAAWCCTLMACSMEMRRAVSCARSPWANYSYHVWSRDSGRHVTKLLKPLQWRSLGRGWCVCGGVANWSTCCIATGADSRRFGCKDPSQGVLICE